MIEIHWNWIRSLLKIVFFESAKHDSALIFFFLMINSFSIDFRNISKSALLQCYNFQITMRTTSMPPPPQWSEQLLPTFFDNSLITCSPRTLRRSFQQFKRGFQAFILKEAVLNIFFFYLPWVFLSESDDAISSFLPKALQKH